MRASDRDRDRAVALLQARCAEGYLSVETFEYRLGLALAVDLGSTKGTWLLGRRVGRARVVAGDELVLGDCPVVLQS